MGAIYLRYLKSGMVDVFMRKINRGIGSLIECEVTGG